MSPQSGLYWLFATVVWNGQTAQEMALSSTDISAPVLKIIRNHVKYNNTDTLSRDFVRLLTIGQVMTSSMSFATIGNSSIGSSWGGGGFLLENIMSPFASIVIEISV